MKKSKFPSPDPDKGMVDKKKALKKAVKHKAKKK